MPQKDRTNPNRKKPRRPDIKPRKRVTKKSAEAAVNAVFKKKSKRKRASK